MITMDEEAKFGIALLKKFKEVIYTGTLKLYPGQPGDWQTPMDSVEVLASIPVSALNLDVFPNGTLSMLGTAAKFTTFRTGLIGWFAIDCRQLDGGNAQDNGYIRGNVSFTGSSSVQRAAAELQLNTLLISVGDGGALSEITPVQFSIRLG
ncbi:MAG: hypothetical protein PHP00_06920 [Thiotrichaceae bacterium]|nr:hypothetical protein [Thiotrichaceae bacterium]